MSDSAPGPTLHRLLLVEAGGAISSSARQTVVTTLGATGGGRDGRC
jgi:hypothetical protein